MGIWTILGLVGSTLVSIWAVMRYVLTQNTRLDNNVSKNIIPFIKSCKVKFEIINEITINKKYPTTYSSFAIINRTPIYFSRTERLLTAGWQSKEIITEMYFFRWHRSKIEQLIKKIVNTNNHINVMALTPWGSDKLGELRCDENPRVFINDEQYKDIENDVEKMLKIGRGKTSTLLYGVPGTGKTRLVKYLSVKYKLPIYSIYLNPEYNNLDILVMFNDIPEKCIVLFEDFDNYFDKRTCIMKNDKVNFTFDVILSVLDGVYNEYNQVLFVMTCNDIDKIDDSLKNRPSRFKYVREITGPSFAKRLEILNGNIEMAELTEGLTTDKIFLAKDLLENHTPKQIIEKIVE